MGERDKLARLARRRGSCQSGAQAEGRGMAETEAEKAYLWAEQEIARVKAEGGTELYFHSLKVIALTALPREIADLPALRSLSLMVTQVADISALQGLTGLQSLSLRGTQVADISALQGLTALQHLDLADTRVADISALRGLNALQSLNLRGTQVADISALRSLTALRSLNLWDTQVADISKLQGLTALQSLNLMNTQVADISKLQGLTTLQSLHLSGTQVDGITALQNLTALLHLDLAGTQVDDISALAGLNTLQNLDLSGTQVRDLRPVLAMPDLGTEEKELYNNGLKFALTPATRADSELARLADIEDGADRTRETLAYLKTLPPYPAPLPWDVPEHANVDAPPPSPKPDPVPTLILTDDNRIDLAHSFTDEQDLRDPIKRKLYEKMPAAVEKLVRFGNRYPQVSDPANALQDLVSVDFEQADILDIHLQIAALSDIRDADKDQPQAEQLDADCLTALNAVLRLGPPITLGHKSVDLFEQRSLEYARTRRDAAVIEGERRIAIAISQADPITTQRARDLAAMVAKAGDTGRMAGARSSFTRNAIIVMSFVGGAAVDAAVGSVVSPVVNDAALFLLEYKDAIMAVAPAWGETGYAWAADLITRAKLIVEDAKKKP